MKKFLFVCILSSMALLNTGCFSESSVNSSNTVLEEVSQITSVREIPAEVRQVFAREADLIIKLDSQGELTPEETKELEVLKKEADGFEEEYKLYENEDGDRREVLDGFLEYFISEDSLDLSWTESHRYRYSDMQLKDKYGNYSVIFTTVENRSQMSGEVPYETLLYTSDLRFFRESYKKTAFGRLKKEHDEVNFTIHLLDNPTVRAKVLENHFSGYSERELSFKKVIDEVVQLDLSYSNISDLANIGILKNLTSLNLQGNTDLRTIDDLIEYKDESRRTAIYRANKISYLNLSYTGISNESELLTFINGNEATSLTINLTGCENLSYQTKELLRTKASANENLTIYLD